MFGMREKDHYTYKEWHGETRKARFKRLLNWLVKCRVGWKCSLFAGIFWTFLAVFVALTDVHTRLMMVLACLAAAMGWIGWALLERKAA